MKKTAREFGIILQEWLDEHKTKRVSGQVKGDEDFMYVMLSLLDDNAKLLPDRETSTVTLTWTIALLLNNHDVLNKAQNELDIQVGTKKASE